MYYLEIRTKNCLETTLDINCFNKSIANIPYTNFLCLVTDDTLTCDSYIDQLNFRFNSACYAIIAAKAILLQKAFRMLQFPYVHSVINEDIIF